MARPKSKEVVLQHGFYSRLFKTAELADLETIESYNLDDSVNLLAVISRRILEMAAEKQTTLDDWLAIANVQASLHVHIATLIRTQQIIGRARDDVAAAFSIALGQVTNELLK